MSKNARRTPAVKKSSPATPKKTLAEAKRAAALHAARVAHSTIAAAELHLVFMSEVGGLIEALEHKFARRRVFLTECVELGGPTLAEALEELRRAEMKAVEAGAAPLSRDTALDPWAPSNEVEQLAAMAAVSRPGDAR